MTSSPQADIKLLRDVIKDVLKNMDRVARHYPSNFKYPVWWRETLERVLYATSPPDTRKIIEVGSQSFVVDTPVLVGHTTPKIVYKILFSSDSKEECEKWMEENDG